MRIYEELYIARPNATDEEVDALNAQLDNVIKQGGGKVDKIDKMGVKRLAYKIGRHSEGAYVLVAFTCPATTVKEVERRLRVSDLVVKFLTVRMDEKLKWLEKRRKAREKRAARKPPPPVAPAAPAAPGEPSAAPGSPMPGAPVPGAPAEARS
jgi:small subunit ribosomal protein S6